MPFEKILLPLDGSELAERALPYARTIAKLKNSEVVLFAVSITNAGDAAIAFSNRILT